MGGEGIMNRVGHIVRFVAKPGLGEGLSQQLAKSIKVVRSETGTEVWIVQISATDPDTVWLYELYRDADALNAHSSTQEHHASIKRMTAFLSTPPEISKIVPVAYKVKRLRPFRASLMRDWLTPKLKRALVVAAALYGIVAIFFTTFLILRKLTTGLSPTDMLIASVLLVAPLVLALLWDRLKGLKVGPMEITLEQVTTEINVELQTAIQRMQGSETIPLVQQIGAAIEEADMELLEVNLRSTPYWWSTRLYLMAALVEEYTEIQRFIFVERDAARLYIGMASPSAVRKALAARFPNYEQIFKKIFQNIHYVTPETPLKQQVENIAYQWPGAFKDSEEQEKYLITPDLLREWLSTALETENREWDGSPGMPSLYAKILTCRGDYVPLVQARQLQMVVNRYDLGVQIAESALRQLLQ
jgi:quinol monooxygenase YgiN